MRTLKITSFILLIHLFYACDKEKDSSQEETANYTISNADTLQHSLGSFGDEEGAWVQVQSSDFQISEVDRDFNTDEIIYCYKADSTFIGIDYVELKSARGSNGASPNNDIVITKLTIKVE